MNKIYIINDVEATCFDKSNDTEKKPIGFRNEIIEIGAVKCNELGEIIDEFSYFLKPKKFPTLSNFCKTLTSIKQSDIDNAQDAKTVLENFFKWSYKETTNDLDINDVKFISQGHYDKRQFRDDLKLNQLPVEVINDNNHFSLKHLHSEQNKLNYPKGVGLGSACKFEKIQFEGTAHRGIDDAKMVARIFQKYIYKFNDKLL